MIKDGDYEEHECAPTLTPEEEKQAAGFAEESNLYQLVLTKPSYNLLQGKQLSEYQ